MEYLGLDRRCDVINVLRDSIAMEIIIRHGNVYTIFFNVKYHVAHSFLNFSENEFHIWTTLRTENSADYYIHNEVTPIKRFPFNVNSTYVLLNGELVLLVGDINLIDNR